VLENEIAAAIAERAPVDSNDRRRRIAGGSERREGQKRRGAGGQKGAAVEQSLDDLFRHGAVRRLQVRGAVILITRPSTH